MLPQAQRRHFRHSDPEYDEPAEIVAFRELQADADLGLDVRLDGHLFLCPMNGKRAAELANGDLTKKVLDRLDESRSAVMMICASLDDDDQRSLVLSDFSLGAAFVTLALEQKLGHWEDFPWRLCRLAVSDLSKLPQVAREALECFDRLGAGM